MLQADAGLAGIFDDADVLCRHRRKKRGDRRPRRHLVRRADHRQGGNAHRRRSDQSVPDRQGPPIEPVLAVEPLHDLIDQTARQGHLVEGPALDSRVDLGGARICYMPFGRNQAPGANAEYIRRLIRNKHESVLEHVAWAVLISRVSRAFTHQLVRRRVGFAFSQLSQQHHDESDVRFVTPPGIDRHPELVRTWEHVMGDSQAAYRNMLAQLSAQKKRPHLESPREELRAIRSAARSVLPNASETVIAATINARALRHFLRIRGGIVGDTEMRRVAAALLESIRPEAPALFCDFSIEFTSYGLPLVVHQPNVWESY
jgi:thymidylate synthase (FAD)